nr:hypothetical protein RTCK_01141 [Rhizobium sp. TCK]
MRRFKGGLRPLECEAGESAQFNFIGDEGSVLFKKMIV